MGTDSKSFLDDPASLRALVERMPAEERAEYNDYKALGLESAFPGRKMVVYQLKAGRPATTEVISFGDFTVDWDMGPAFNVFTPGGQTQIITTPKRLRPHDLFLHVPQKFELRYKGRQTGAGSVDFVSHFAVLIKTRSKEIHQVDGHTYCVTLNSFRERFPDLKIRY